MDQSRSDNAIYIPKAAIVEAYRSTNPVSTMQSYLETLPVTYADVDLLLTRIWHTKSPNFVPSHPQHDMQDLIRQFYDSGTEEWSAEGFKSRLIFFSCSMVHLWGKWEDEHFCLQNVREPIVAYAYTNRPVPYVWFHAKDNGEIILMKHVFRVTPAPLKVLQTTMRAANSMLLDHYSYDLHTNKRMSSTQQGSFLNLVLRQDHDGFLEIPQSGATAMADFIVILTYGKRQQLCNVYYNQRQPKKIWALNAVAHHTDF